MEASWSVLTQGFFFPFTMVLNSYIEVVKGFSVWSVGYSIAVHRGVWNVKSRAIPVSGTNSKDELVAHRCHLWESSLYIYLRIVLSDMITITYVFGVKTSINAANVELRTSMLWKWACSLLWRKLRVEGQDQLSMLHNTGGFKQLKLEHKLSSDVIKHPSPLHWKTWPSSTGLNLPTA